VSDRRAVSALFDSEEAVETAIVRLESGGLPRDRVEVVVSRAAAGRWYRGRARGRRGQPLVGAGVGAVVGLIAGTAIALSVVALPGQEPGTVAFWAQLLGPNLMSLAGALLGAAIGLFVKEPAAPVWRRALGSEGILVVVEGCDAAEAAAAADALTAAGGREVETSAEAVPSV
jgi:MFS family permease